MPRVVARSTAARPLAGLLAAATVWLAGCPPPPHIVVDAGVPDDAGVVDAGPGGLDPTGYCEDIVDFFCPFYLRCGRMAVPDEETCRSVFLEACNARFEPTYVSLVNAGLLTLSQEGIDACRAHLQTVECDQQVQDLEGPCADMWVGTQAAGEPCGFDIESFTCAPGTVCAVDLTGCGVCESVVDDGASCEPDGVTCGHDSVCDSVSLTCKARKHPGESCGGNDPCVLGATCHNQVCAAPSYVGVGDACDFADACPYAAACAAGVCQATVELGESCGADVECDSGFCDGTSTTCTALVPQGGACQRSAQCQTKACDNGLCTSVPSACFSAAPPAP